jgi:hypothetical protein
MADVIGTRLVGPSNKRDHVEVVTNSRTRLVVRAEDAGLEFAAAAADLAAPTPVGRGVVFFRDRGDGKAQCCVRFPSGAVQVLATEP